MFILYANKNQLAVKQKEPLTSGSVNIYQCRFEFSHDWTGLTRKAMFIGSGSTIQVLLDEHGECIIPWEVLTQSGWTLYAGVYGSAVETALPTIKANLGQILEGVKSEGDVPVPPTPDIYEQIMSAAQKAIDTANSVRADADAGLFIGPEGPAGPAGSQGEQGEPGIQGPEGKPGLDGEQGPIGPIGPQGERGEKGEQGDIGPVGPQGDIGPMGPVGPQGPEGPRGQDGTVSFDELTPEQRESLRGEPGPAGEQGPVGPAGPAGEQGIPGPTGPQGERGLQGEQGLPGEAGPMGPAGERGESGPAGFSPTVSIENADGEHKVTITDETGEHEFIVLDGKQGQPGLDGEPGQSGADGISPIVKVEPIDGGNKVTVTDKDGNKTFDVMNGVDGKPGEPGEPGKDALINGKNVLNIAAGENVTIEQAYDTLTISASGGSGISFTTDDTLTLQDDVLSVSLPTKSLTSSEYDKLDQDDKMSNTIFLVSESNDSKIFSEIYGIEFDTDDDTKTLKFSFDVMDYSININKFTTVDEIIEKFAGRLGAFLGYQFIYDDGTKRILAFEDVEHLIPAEYEMLLDDDPLGDPVSWSVSVKYKDQNIGGKDVYDALASKQPMLTGNLGQLIGIGDDGAAKATVYPSNPNLLDNWYFPNPINQRGKNEYNEDVSEYTIDRWRKYTGRPSVTIEETGIKLSTGDFGQPIELPRIRSGTYTISLLTADNQLDALTFQISGEDESYQVFTKSYTTGTTGYSVSFAYKWISTTHLFYINNRANGANVVAVKLERGPIQTLAHKEGDNWVLNNSPPNYQEELTKCQRYYIKFDYVAGSTVGFYACATTFTAMVLPLPVTMRASASYTITGTMYKSNGWTDLPFPSTGTMGSVTRGTANFGFSSSGTPEAGYVAANTAVTIELNANL